MSWDEWRGSLDGRSTMWIKHLVEWWGCRVDLHKMIGADDAACFHTHPAYALRLVLFGGYHEEVVGSRGLRRWRPGAIGLVTPSLCHRVASLRNGRVSYSLWIRFRKIVPIQLHGAGWKQQQCS